MLKRFKFPGWKRVLMFTALVCALPLVPEALLLVDVVGLEATFVFLFLYAQSSIQDLASRASYGYYVVESKIQNQPAYQAVSGVGFGLSAAASFFVFWATGSLVFAVCTLGPAILSQV